MLYLRDTCSGVLRHARIPTGTNNGDEQTYYFFHFIDMSQYDAQGCGAYSAPQS
jgi:hypothetical protein